MINYGFSAYQARGQTANLRCSDEVETNWAAALMKFISLRLFKRPRWGKVRHHSLWLCPRTHALFLKHDYCSAGRNRSVSTFIFNTADLTNKSFKTLKQNMHSLKYDTARRKTSDQSSTVGSQMKRQHTTRKICKLSTIHTQ